MQLHCGCLLLDLIRIWPCSVLAAEAILRVKSAEAYLRGDDKLGQGCINIGDGACLDDGGGDGGAAGDGRCAGVERGDALREGRDRLGERRAVGGCANAGTKF